ncbi:MAG: ATP-dependent DNA helicase RecG [Rickettsiales bacterium]|jgi:ATP-dependent DNA helicase RecG|nr:ATP-dependent DNA helicase RecG [Rickettsiales bacterium]
MRPEILNFLFTSISNLSGVGDKTKQNYIRLLTKKKVAAGESLDPKMFNLLFHLPERVLRRRIIDNVGEITDGDVITAKVKVISHNPPGRTKQPYTITCFLGQNFLNIVYYTYYENYINVKFRIDGEVFVSGRIEFYNSQLQMVHPDYVATKITDIPQLEPIYPLTYNLSNREVSKNVDFIMNNCPDLPEWLEEGILKANDWVSWRESLLNLHYPKCVFDMVNNKYIKRLAFDEILAQQLALAMVRSSDARRNEKQILENKTKSLKNKFLNEILQFELTNDQLNAIAEIEGNTFSSKKMMRLLQGDVGSGKTVVAFVSMLNYVENKKQCVLMVPTSILAAQHFETITGFCEKLGLNVGILTSKIKGKVRNATLQKLKSGDINILVGTHALIEDNVEFKDLGFVIIDEQHRFGVEQRMLLINKNKNADILAMSATPIPRTLALTIYSDMDLSVLREKPKNRKEIITSIVTVDKYDNLIGRIRERIKGDEKVYWICPLVEESKNMELTDIRNKYDEFCELFGSENIAFLHGRMKEKEKDAVMEDFCENRRKKI